MLGIKRKEANIFVTPVLWMIRECSGRMDEHRRRHEY